MGEIRAPQYDDVLTDLKKLREHGIGRIRHLKLPALNDACQFTDIAGEMIAEPAAVVDLLRRATDTLGGGFVQEAAEYTFGLAEGSALWPGKVRREHAAAKYEIIAETFRKKPERDLIAQVVEGVLAQCHEARLRRTRLDMEQQRHPADSRLAVQWVERFEAYYRIWTPVYALAANLEAALETYLHEPADHLPWDSESERPYVPELQARGYARSALYNYAQFQLELKRFMSRHGGLWLLSDAETEQQAADAVYRIGWHNNFDDEDESWLRRQLADSRHEETEHFWNVLRSFTNGLRIHDQWQGLVHLSIGLETDEQKAGSQVWLTIAACHDYCDLIDADWLKIADWYRPGSTPRRGISGKSLIGDLADSRVQIEQRSLNSSSVSLEGPL